MSARNVHLNDGAEAVLVTAGTLKKTSRRYASKTFYFRQVKYENAYTERFGKDSLREWVRPDGDPGKIARKALTNMVMEKAIDYPEPKPDFMQI